MSLDIKEHFYIISRDVVVGTEARHDIATDDLEQVFANGADSVVGTPNLFSSFELYKEKSVDIGGETYKNEPESLGAIVFATDLVDYITAINDVPPLSNGISQPGGLFDGAGRVTKKDQADYIQHVKDLFAEAAQRKDVISHQVCLTSLMKRDYRLIEKSASVVDVNTGKLLHKPL